MAPLSRASTGKDPAQGCGKNKLYDLLQSRQLIGVLRSAASSLRSSIRQWEQTCYCTWQHCRQAIRSERVELDFSCR